MPKVVTFGEVMLRLSTPGYLRFSQAHQFDATFGGGEANVAVSLANYGVDAEFYCAELSFDALAAVKGARPVYRPLPRFPSVTRDIAVVCRASIPVGEMVDCILANGGAYLKDCTLFDVYTGSHIAPGMKSVAFSLTMRSDDQTLTDDHAEETVAKVLKALNDSFGAVMR